MGTTADLCGSNRHNESCTLCEKKSVAYWMGLGTTIHVCQDCALNILPALIADAIVGTHGHLPYMAGYLNDCVNSIEKVYWRAAALAIHRRKTTDSRETRPASVNEF